MPQSIITPDNVASKLYFDPVVLKTESKEDFAKLVEALNSEVKPVGFIERLYVEDVAHLLWEIMRLRRIIVATINTTFKTALKIILMQILVGPASGPRPEMKTAAARLARDWFVTEEVRGRVSGLLQEAGLDESAIEAEAYRLRMDDIQKLDRALTLAESRRDRAFRMIFEFKESFAMRLQQNVERVLAYPAANISFRRIDQGERASNGGQPTQCKEEYRASFSFWKETVQPKRASPWIDQARFFGRFWRAA
jgi:hypothetical protein